MILLRAVAARKLDDCKTLLAKFIYGEERLIEAIEDRFPIRYIHMTIWGFLEYKNVFQEDPKNKLALILAAKSGYTGITKLLLSIPEININHQDKEGNTALIHAIKVKGINVAKLLLSRVKRIDVNLQNKNLETALTCACANDSIGGIIEYLLKIPTLDVNVQDKKGFTPLMYAVESGYNEMVTWLLKLNDVNVNLQDNAGNTALILATRDNHTKIVNSLISQETRKQRSPPEWWRSLEKQNQLYIESLITGHSCSSPGLIKKIIHELGDVGLNDDDMKKFLDWYFYKFKREIDAGITNNSGFDALTYACSMGEKDIVQAIMKAKGVDVNYQDPCGNTALMHCANKGYLGAACLLIDAQPDVNLQNQFGDTVLINLARHRHTYLLQNILNLPGSDINIQNHRGDTALHVACRGNNENILRVLLRFPNINVNVRNHEGKTGLMYAAVQGYTQNVNLLLEFDCDYSLLDNEGRNALLLAQLHGHNTSSFI